MKTLQTIAVVCGAILAAANSTHGQTWTLTSAPSNKWYSVASSADGTKVIAAVNPGSIYTSAD